MQRCSDCVVKVLPLLFPLLTLIAIYGNMTLSHCVRLFMQQLAQHISLYNKPSDCI